ncbi:helix-turn-helix domain-containing protein [Legionella hackeliae]|uniref:Putative DNA-binding protein n=1 Tax=Legionella hackeliae TaxID=449 RepID=A0A0A8UV54_LEGHA|nr:helix-turn-helix domain-containing protein [Legionella hackeliae]KTD13925.1 DNA-binding protein [Legionella hackeliae]CEK10629.1 putative DNA-binding protein [Legionella hackeliae]STX47371.1 DNA-binding protein [Legionella hackeliae]
MNTTTAMDEVHKDNHEKPGVQLAQVREKKGYSQEYVAGKLHLRVRIIELLEADNYQQMPEPVFIKGYLRAYAKLLGVPAEPLLAAFNSMHTSERKLEKALWQSKRESNKGERVVRWLTGLIAITAVVAVGIWWQKIRDTQQIDTAKSAQNETVAKNSDPDIRLTDLSKMQSMFSSTSSSGQLTPLENQGG